ncbi:unnamed protein product [Choristocarpus tenellus]
MNCAQPTQSGQRGTDHREGSGLGLGLQYGRSRASKRSILHSGVKRLPPFSDTPLGEGMLDILDLFPPQGNIGNVARQGDGRRVSLTLRDPITKRRTSSTVEVMLRCRHVDEIMDTCEHRVFEHEYWTDTAGWIGLGQDNRERWSTMDGSVFSNSFQEVAPPPEDDSEVVLPWCPFGGWQYTTLLSRWPSSNAKTTAEEDHAGEERDQIWLEHSQNVEVVERRRLWRRVCLLRPI